MDIPKRIVRKIEETEDYTKYHVEGWFGKRGFAKRYSTKKYSRMIEYDVTVYKGQYYEIPFDLRDEYESP